MANRSNRLTIPGLGRKITRWLMPILIWLMSCIAITPHADCSQYKRPEVAGHLVKAAYLYKFLYFIEWPETALKKTEKTITIGIVGGDPFGDAFKPVEGKLIHLKEVKNRYGKGNFCNIILEDINGDKLYVQINEMLYTKHQEELEDSINKTIIISGSMFYNKHFRKNSMRAKQAATYPMTKGNIFRCLTSCQNLDIVLGEAAIPTCVLSYKLA